MIKSLVNKLWPVSPQVKALISLMDEDGVTWHRADDGGITYMAYGNVLIAVSRREVDIGTTRGARTHRPNRIEAFLIRRAVRRHHKRKFHTPATSRAALVRLGYIFKEARK